MDEEQNEWWQKMVEYVAWVRQPSNRSATSSLLADEGFDRFIQPLQARLAAAEAVVEAAERLATSISVAPRGNFPKMDVLRDALATYRKTTGSAQGENDG